ncbi:MAG TPA: GAD-like domain-containing protein [Iamia sp.]|nr:GAD-like domain-containing protein [Iamia sp.]
MDEQTGFDDGRLWRVDADVWQPAVDLWTAGVDLDPGTHTWVPITRNAFGTMRLSDPDTGTNLTIHPARGWIFPAHEPDDELEPDDLDVFDVDDRPLFHRARERLGPVDPDTLYAFVPALGQGGAPRLENLEVVDALPHVVELAATTERRIFPDVSIAPRR